MQGTEHRSHGARERRRAVQFLNYNDATTYGDGAGPARQYGDIRYNFLRWVSDQDVQDSLRGRDDARLRSAHGRDRQRGDRVQRLRHQGLLRPAHRRVPRQRRAPAPGSGSAAWPMGSCTTGTTQQLVTSTVVSQPQRHVDLVHEDAAVPRTSTGRIPPTTTWDRRTSPPCRTRTSIGAYFALAPYEVFADPDMNLFVTREGGQGVYGPASVWQRPCKGETAFQQLTANINNGDDAVPDRRRQRGRRATPSPSPTRCATRPAPTSSSS